MKYICFSFLIIILYLVVTSFGGGSIAVADVGFDSTSTCPASGGCGAPTTTHNITFTTRATSTAVVAGGNLGGVAISTITWATSTSFTDIVANASNDCARCMLYYVASSATGTQSFTITKAGSDNASITAVSFNSTALTSDIVGSKATSTCSSCTALAMPLTSTRDGSMYVDNFTFNAGNPSAISVTGAGQVLAVENAPFGDVQSRMSYKPVAVSGTSSTMSWSWTGASTAFIALAELRVVGAAVASDEAVITTIIIE